MSQHTYGIGSPIHEPTQNFQNDLEVIAASQVTPDYQPTDPHNSTANDLHRCPKCRAHIYGNACIFCPAIDAAVAHVNEAEAFDKAIDAAFLELSFRTQSQIIWQAAKRFFTAQQIEGASR